MKSALLHVYLQVQTIAQLSVDHRFLKSALPHADHWFLQSALLHVDYWFLKSALLHVDYWFLKSALLHDYYQGLKLRKYFRGQVGPYQINATINF
jgi:hypothetical protein